MPNLNTAIVSLVSLESGSLNIQDYILILIFLALIFTIFSQRIFYVESPYYIICATLVIIFIMSFVIFSILAVDTKLENNGFFIFSDSIFNNPSSRNFLSIMSLILFIMLVYELVEYDNNNPHYMLDRLMFGHNNYISNRFGGVALIFVFSLFIAYTVMTTTKL